MKRCPECGRTFTNSTLAYCLNDGIALVEDVSQPPPASGGTPLPAFSVNAKTSYTGAAQTLYSGARRRKFPWRGALSVALILVLLGRTWVRIHQAQWNSVPNSALRLSLTTVIKKADYAERLSVRSLDPGPLSSSFTGPELSHELSRVQDLKNTGTLVDERFLAQNYTGFRVSPNHSEAQVDVTETWTTAIYLASIRRKAGVFSAHDMSQTVCPIIAPQTVFLRQTGGIWKVEKVKID